MDGKLKEISEEQWNVKPQPHFSIPSFNPPYFLSTKQQTHWKNTITIYLFSEQTHLKNPYFLHHLVIYLNENKNKKWKAWGERWSKEAHHGFGSAWEKELGV